MKPLKNPIGYTPANPTAMPIVAPSESQKPYPEVENDWDPTPAARPIADFTSPAKNTDIVTSADMNKTDVQGSAIPAMGSGYGFGRMNTPAPIGGMQSTMAQKPENYLSPEARKYMGYGQAALGGYNAGANMMATPDESDAMLQVAGSTVGGAAMGLAAGGPVGAVVGGLTGLVTGGLNALVGTSSARKQRREQERIRQEIAAKEEARYRQARKDAEKYFNIERGDNQEQQRYNRRMAAIQSQWQAQESARRALNDAIQNNSQLKMMLTQEVR